MDLILPCMLEAGRLNGLVRYGHGSGSFLKLSLKRSKTASERAVAMIGFRQGGSDEYGRALLLAREEERSIMQQLCKESVDATGVLRRRILVCDDEREIADMVARLMEREGFSCAVCYDPFSTLDSMRKNASDLVILDIMMPGMDGYELARRIREFSNVPLIFLTAKDEEVDSVLGFAVGADDYVTKPFRPRELAMRVRACLRRAAAPASPASDGVLRMCGIELDSRAHEVSLHGEPLALTPKEFALLQALMEAGGSPRSAAELFEHVWGQRPDAAASNTVMVHVRHLRKKLAAIDSSTEFVATVWGVGYRMNAG